LRRKAFIAQHEIAIRRPADLIHQTRFQLVTKQLTVRRLTACSVCPQGVIQRMRLQQLIDFTPRVRPVTRPAIFCRVPRHARAYQVQFDVTLAGEQVGFFLRQARAEASFPKRAASAVGSVHVLNVALAQGFH
jgi:hypothetical protein